MFRVADTLRSAAARLGVRPTTDAIRLRALSGAAAGTSAEAPDLERKRTIHRLMYRSRQRGFLELDLLVGSWAEEHLNDMTSQELSELSAVLDQENPDLFSWLTGQTDPSPEMAGNGVYLRLREHVAAAMDRMPEHCKAAKGSAWVRGWDDKGGKVAPGLGLAGGDGWPVQEKKDE